VAGCKRMDKNKLEDIREMNVCNFNDRLETN
jgi:hypothetical protein